MVVSGFCSPAEAIPALLSQETVPAAVDATPPANGNSAPADDFFSSEAEVSAVP